MLTMIFDECIVPADNITPPNPPKHAPKSNHKKPLNSSTMGFKSGGRRGQTDVTYVSRARDLDLTPTWQSEIFFDCGLMEAAIWGYNYTAELDIAMTTTILRAGSMMVPVVAVRRRLLSNDTWRCLTCSSLNSRYAHSNDSNGSRSRSFATSRQKRAMKQKEGAQGKKKSIHGLRPNQTPSAAVENATTASMPSQHSGHQTIL